MKASLIWLSNSVTSIDVYQHVRKASSMGGGSLLVLGCFFFCCWRTYSIEHQNKWYSFEEYYLIVFGFFSESISCIFAFYYRIHLVMLEKKHGKNSSKLKTRLKQGRRKSSSQSNCESLENHLLGRENYRDRNHFVTETAWKMGQKSHF